MRSFVAICGNMGSGKTTLCERLDTRPGVEVIQENFRGNAYLARFYDDMPTWALRSQLRFLVDRQVAARKAATANILLEDRSILEDIHVFAGNLFEQGIISDDDWNLYKDIADLLVEAHPKYDLIVYLRADTNTLMKRIVRRGRPMEKDIDPAYLEALQVRYDAFVRDIGERIPILTIDTDVRDLRSPTESEAAFQEIRLALQDRAPGTS
jgi:deoxyadenosine/deoxycytidine kinase